MKVRFLTSKDIYNIFHPLLCDLHNEEFWILFVSKSNKVIDKIRISQGGVFQTVVDNKILFREAISRSATGIVLCHNHPSGNPEPSCQDDAITAKIKHGAQIFDISLMDHVIVCDGYYYSYADEGRL